ncbi:hypothetical protein ABZ749_29565, partial [Micromonospora sp. NPDC047753]|uniref:hypothetical protein n=1 Tax=Micromonospora sp. NPDC047753 TaxID=3154817 RepID=UPI0033F71648
MERFGYGDDRAAVVGHAVEGRDGSLVRARWRWSLVWAAATRRRRRSGPRRGRGGAFYATPQEAKEYLLELTGSLLQY